MRVRPGDEHDSVFIRVAVVAIEGSANYGYAILLATHP
jgi:hypothetical protein